MDRKTDEVDSIHERMTLEALHICVFFAFHLPVEDVNALDTE